MITQSHPKWCQMEPGAQQGRQCRGLGLILARSEKVCSFDRRKNNLKFIKIIPKLATDRFVRSGQSAGGAFLARRSQGQPRARVLVKKNTGRGSVGAGSDTPRADSPANFLLLSMPLMVHVFRSFHKHPRAYEILPVHIMSCGFKFSSSHYALQSFPKHPRIN